MISRKLSNSIRRLLHLTPRAFLRPRVKRSAAAWFAGLREREERKIEIERKKIADIEARMARVREHEWRQAAIKRNESLNS